MKFRLALFCLVSALALLQITKGYAQISPIPWTEWEREDSRLAKRVTFSGSGLYSGQLMEELSRQTGVALTVTDRDGGAGEPLATSLQDAPLSEILQAFWSFASYQGASWQVTRIGVSPTFRYVIERPLAARNLCTKMQTAIQSDFEKYARDLMQGVNASPNERQSLAKRNPTLGTRLNQEATREGISLFARQTSEEERLKILRGEMQLTVPIARLDEKDMKLFRDLWKTLGAYNTSEDGTKKYIDAPDVLKFKTETNGNRLTPIMFIDYGEMGALSYIGDGLYESDWQKKTRDGWILPSDARERPELGDRGIRRPEPPTGTKRKETKTLFDQLDEMADAAGISFLAHLPVEETGPITPKNKTLASLLSEFKPIAVTPFQYKWRGNFLLLTYPRWFTQDAEKRNAPWGIVKRLRDAKGRPEVEDLYALAALGKDQALAGLAEEFPGALFVQRWHRVLRWVAQSPLRREEFVSKKGVAPTQGMVNLMAGFDLDFYHPAGADALPQTRCIRLVISETKDDKGILFRLFQIVLVDKDGASIAGSGADFHPVVTPQTAE